MRVVTSSYWFPNSRTRKWNISGGQSGWRRCGKFTFEIFGSLNIYFIYSSLIRTTTRITDLISQCKLMVKLNRRILDRRLTSELTVIKIPSMAPVFGHKASNATSDVNQFEYLFDVHRDKTLECCLVGRAEHQRWATRVATIYLIFCRFGSKLSAF